MGNNRWRIRFFFLVCLLLGIAILLDAQEITFRLFGYDQCTNSYEKIELITLEKDNQYFMAEDTTWEIKLKEPGLYLLHTDIGLVEYYLDEFKTYSDTINIKYIYRCYTGTTRVSFTGFCCCEEKCNGYQIDYYTNGNKRVEGYFKKGRPIGKLFFYYSDGVIMEKYIATRKGKIKKHIEYDKDGNIIKVTKFKPKKIRDEDL